MAVYYSLSVHQFVDFLLRAGDIDNRIYNQETMGLGSKLHAAFQESQGRDYLSEVALSGMVEVESGTIVLQGRSDGIIVGGAYPIIDEIKSTVQDLHVFASVQEAWHLGQALTYAYLYLKQKGGEKIGIRLTYLSQVGKDRYVRDFVYSAEEVYSHIENLAREYIAYMADDRDHVSSRDASTKELKFPFGEFRKGQRELSRLVYGAIDKRRILFAEAPTGIGKTMATLFPSVKSFSKGRVDRIFYLTAKSTGANAAYDAVTGLREAGLDVRDSFLMAKEKICLTPGASCNPDECPYAKDYYTKLKGALAKAKKELTRFEPGAITQFCIHEGLCPFEFQLDLSLSSDIIVADYNYFFDPMVYLERYFDEGVDSSTYVCLIDEAHNLVKRSRDMYSVTLSEQDCAAAAKALKGDAYKSLRNALNKVKKALKDLSEEETGIPLALEKSLESYKRAKQKEDKKEQEGKSEEKAKEKPGQAYMEFSREISRWNTISQFDLEEDYHLRIHEGAHPSITLYCLDPSPYLMDCFLRVRSAILFSATLTPMSYYQESLTGSENHGSLLLSSPFPRENFKVMVHPRVTTRYKVRDRFYGEVASCLSSFVNAKMGNYFLYFPSYEYMEKVAPLLRFKDADVHIQERAMGDRDRQIFLSNFLPNPSKTNVGLLVLGGAFSEGIDLVDDRLIGVGIVGIGLPQVGDDTEDLRAYYEKTKGEGYPYAYLYPGINKVFQALGRVIRSESDVGAALLMDERFLSGDFRESLERLYPQLEVVMDESEIKDSLSRFYKKK